MPELPEEVRNAHREVARLVAQRAALLREAARRGAVDHQRLAGFDAAIAGVLDRVRDLVDPCDASEAVPLVLLPVRLETRFGTSGNIRSSLS